MLPLIYSHGAMKVSNMTVPCWVCSGTLSRQAKVCPHCGHPEPAEESIKRFEQLRQQELKDAASSDRHRREGSAFSSLISGIFVVSLLLAIWFFIMLAVLLVAGLGSACPCSQARAGAPCCAGPAPRRAHDSAYNKSFACWRRSSSSFRSISNHSR